MDESAYKKHLHLDRHHFWRKGKRRLVMAWLRHFTQGKRDLKILDIGSACSLLPVEMCKYGQVVAIDPHEPSVQMARKELRLDARVGCLPDDVPVDEKFDVITMFDVLEHIEDEAAALKKVKSLLSNDGILLLTVPAYQWMFSDHDRILRHCRRYSRSRLGNVLIQSGYSIERISYYTCFLFPFALASRAKCLVSSKQSGEYNVKVPFLPVNAVFAFVMFLERCFLKFFSLPFGLSLIAVCSKTD